MRTSIHTLILAILIYPSIFPQQGTVWELATSNAPWPVRIGFRAEVFVNKIWLFGGMTPSGTMLHDVWNSTDGSQWLVSTTAAQWSARRYHSSVVFGGKLWIMGGGESSSVFFNDVWQSIDGINWTQVISYAPWEERIGHQTVEFNGKIFLIGGENSSQTKLSDIWQSTNGVNWTLVTSGQWPARTRHRVVVYENKIWVLGGYSSSGDYLNDVWYSSDGISWQQATANAAWSGRTGHTVVVENGKIFLMGGFRYAGFNQYLNDVWYSSDGINWEVATLDAAWSARYTHESVAFNSNIWVIGSNTYSDVWYSEDITLQTNWAVQESGVVDRLNGVDFISSQIGWAVGRNGIILHTTDGGQNWQIQNSNTSVRLRGVKFLNAILGWTAGETGVILQTTDGGNNWHNQNTGVPWDITGGIWFTDSLNGWACGSSNDLLRTTNSGQSWFTQTTPAEAGGIADIRFESPTRGFFLSRCYVQGYWYGAIYETINSGTDWSLIFTGGDVGGSFYHCDFIGQNYGWIVGTGGQILNTTNGGDDWVLQESGVNELLLNVSFLDSSNGWVVGDLGKILKTTNGGLDWTDDISNTISLLRAVDFIDINNGWTVGDNGLILKYTSNIPTVQVLFPNGGESFQSETGLNIQWSASGGSIDHIAIYYSTDGGATFSNITQSTSNSGNYTWQVPLFYSSHTKLKIVSYDSSNNIVAIGISNPFTVYSPSLKGTIYITSNPSSANIFIDGINTNQITPATISNVVAGYHTIRLSRPPWQDWSESIEILPNITTNVNGNLTLNLSNGNQYWLVTIYNYQYVGTVTLNAYDMQGNYGTWSVNSALIVDVNILNRGYDPFGLMSGRRFSVLDTVNTIQPCLYTDDHDFSIITSIDYQTSINRSMVFSIGNFHGETFRLKYSSSDGTFILPAAPIWITEVEEENKELPKQYILAQNYPNPFNPTTMIKYSIPEVSKVALKLYNLLGEEVVTLVNEEREAGYHQVEFNAANLPSGVYFYQLKAGDFISTKKMILLK